MDDFSTYDFFNEAIFVLDNNNSICYCNSAFETSFSKAVNDINKLSTYFDFNACPFDTSQIYEFNPLLLAVKSKENYACYAINVNDEQNYEIFTQNINSHKIFIIRRCYDDILQFDKKIKALEDENKKVEMLKQKAQSQAVKIALLNRIYTIIQKENQLDKILEYTYEELKQVFGVDKLFYAKYQKNNNVIEYVFPAKYNNSIGDFVDLKSDNTKVFTYANYLKEFDTFKTEYKTTSTRVVVPVYNQNEHLGELVFTLPNKNFVMIDEDFLNSLCSQLAAAVLQALLAQQLKENQLQLINSEKMATLGNMVAAVAHEINTPLGSINSNNEMVLKLLNQAITTNPDDRTYKMLLTAVKCDKEAINRITTIVKSLKKFIRLDESQMQLTDIANELDLTLNLCQHVLKNKVTVIKEYNNIPNIYTHPNMLNQVFMNIIVNAAQSITEKGTITISINSFANKINILIKDTGCGISDEIKNKIFEQGFTTKDKSDGSGLGLSISKKIIEQLGGELSFTSKVDLGTEFVITLPVGESLN